LVCLQSFGFALFVRPERSNEVISLFRKREITAAMIGRVVVEPMIMLRNGPESEVLFDFRKDKITGIVYQPDRG
jgi:selenophosphate synthetase-related protein